MHLLACDAVDKPARQRGTTLVVAMVLLLLASLLGLFALNVGMFEQRASGNDVRARLVQQATEAALSQGAEYFRAHTSELDIAATDAAGNPLWQPCDPDDVSFPCGAVTKEYALTDEQVAAGMKCPGTGVGTTCPRRSTMYRFIGGSGAGVIDKRSLKIDQPLGKIGNGYDVNSRVGALLCLVRQPQPSAPGQPAEPTSCTSDPAQASTMKFVTMVGVGDMPGESAHTTLSFSISRQSSINNPAGKPPFVASGTVNLLGTMQIVTNPNAAGFGVPVTVWTRQTIDGHGTPNTCHMDEFMRFGYKNANKAPVWEGENPPIITCDDCSCVDAYSLSLASGNSVTGGIDILYGPPTQPNQNGSYTDIKDAGYTNYRIRKNEFPCDLFQYVFATPAWKDTNDDGFCETALRQDYTSNGQTVTNGRVDEAYLYDKASKIIPTAANKKYVPAAKLADCSYLTAGGTSGKTSAATGLIWDQTGCGIGSNTAVGSPDAPVLLVIDSSGAPKIQGRMFGLLFIRSTNDPLNPADGGGTDVISMNAGAAIYGSIVVQGSTSHLTGTAALIFNEAVLGNLVNEAPFNPISPVPGSWTDRFSY